MYKLYNKLLEHNRSGGVQHAAWMNAIDIVLRYQDTLQAGRAFQVVEYCIYKHKTVNC